MNFLITFSSDPVGFIRSEPIFRFVSQFMNSIPEGWSELKHTLPTCCRSHHFCASHIDHYMCLSFLLVMGRVFPFPTCVHEHFKLLELDSRKENFKSQFT